MSTSQARVCLSALCVFTLLSAALAGAQTPNQLTTRGPIQLHVFAGPAAEPEDAAGLADSVTDFKEAAVSKHAGTFHLVESQQLAELSIEISKRDRELFGRDMWLVVRRRGCPAERVYRGITGGRFTDVAHFTLRLMGIWWNENLAAASGSTLSGCGTTFNVFLDVRDLQIPDPAIRANAASRLGAQGRQAVTAVPALLALVGDKSIVRRYDVESKKYTGSTVVGFVAAQALARVEGLERLYSVLATDSREQARIYAASALRNLAATQSEDALRAAARDDKSAKVRKAVEELLVAPSR
jgi:hypothetical protein